MIHKVIATRIGSAVAAAALVGLGLAGPAQAAAPSGETAHGTGHVAIGTIAPRSGTAQASPGSSSPSSGIIGYYYIKAENSRKCLEDHGWSTKPSTVIDQWSCARQKNEWWDIEYAGSWHHTNLVTIKNVYSGQCAAVKGGSRVNGTPIVQWKCSSDNSKWWITHVKSSGGYEWYNVHNLNTGKCLNIAGNSNANGARLIEYDCVYAANEHFTFPHKT